MPLISVVVPSRNRSESVRRLLRSLAAQEPVDGGFEAIVVADGCTDGTARHVASATWPFDVHVLEQSPSGPSVARNCGAALARGRILLFLDDDVEAEPDLLRAHAACHAAQSRRVALGYLPPVVPAGLFGKTLRNWWEGMFDGPRQVWHRYSYRDLLSGHFSVERAEFEALGGFDVRFACHEDWELGYRAIEAGLALTFLPGAVAWHHEATDLERSLRRKFDEGVADVQLADKHPDLIRAMPLGRERGLAWRSRVARAAWDHPVAGDRIMIGARRLLALYERWNLRFRWRALLDRMLGYSYWRGVAQALGSRAALEALLARAPEPAPPELIVDVAAGIDAAARLVDAQRPRSVRLVYGPSPLGEIADVAGAERLRSVHLRRAVARDVGVFLASAVAERRGLPALFVTPAA